MNALQSTRIAVIFLFTTFFLFAAFLLWLRTSAGRIPHATEPIPAEVIAAAIEQNCQTLAAQGLELAELYLLVQRLEGIMGCFEEHFTVCASWPRKEANHE